MSALLIDTAQFLHAANAADFCGPPPPPEKRMGEIRRGVIAKKGDKFANDGSYASVEALLHRLAVRFHARIMAMGGLGMDFDDVRAECDVSYLKAFKAWSPQRGVRFSTYLQTACQHNFQERIKKVEAERANLGMYSYDARLPGEDDMGDPLERLESYTDGSTAEDTVAARWEMRERLKGLTPAAQRFVTAMLLVESRNDLDKSATRVRNIAIAAGLSDAELRRVKVEITAKFGHEW